MGCKACNKCSVVKPLHQFSRDNTKAGGLSGQCRACKAIAYKEWYEKRRVEAEPSLSPWERPLTEALLDVGLKRWRYPVDRANLAWRIAA